MQNFNVESLAARDAAELREVQGAERWAVLSARKTGNLKRAVRIAAKAVVRAQEERLQRWGLLAARKAGNLKHAIRLAANAHARRLHAAKLAAAEAAAAGGDAEKRALQEQVGEEKRAMQALQKKVASLSEQVRAASANERSLQAQLAALQDQLANQVTVREAARGGTAARLPRGSPLSAARSS